jgi:phosphoglycolate phosphatase-like HAD superfamily hydrolase
LLPIIIPAKSVIFRNVLPKSKCGGYNLFMKLFVWDFHGTLEKGFESAVLEFTNRSLEHHGYAVRMDQKAVNALYGKKWTEYFKLVLPEESPETHLKLQNYAISDQRNNPHVVAGCVRPNDYAEMVLEEISKKHDQILISHTDQTDIEEFVKAAKLDRFFPAGQCFGINAHQIGRAKDDALAEYLQGKHYDKIIFIGDSPHDMIQVENAIHYLYAHPGKQFREGEAHYKINDLREVLKEA